MLALTFVMLLGAAALRLVLGASEVYARSQALTSCVQLAMQEANGMTAISDRYSIKRQSSQQQLGAGASIRRNVIGVYDEAKAVYILSLVVYE